MPLAGPSMPQTSCAAVRIAREVLGETEEPGEAREVLSLGDAKFAALGIIGAGCASAIGEHLPVGLLDVAVLLSSRSCTRSQGSCFCGEVAPREGSARVWLTSSANDLEG